MRLRNPLKLSVVFACLVALVVVASAADRPRLFQKKTPPKTTTLLETGHATLDSGPATFALNASTGKIGDGALRKKLLLAVVRHRTIGKLQTDGLKGKKLTKTEAETAYDNLAKNHPELIDGAVAEASAPATAQLAGGRLTDFLQWLSDHSAEIMKIVEMVLSILALFGDPMAMILTGDGIVFVYPTFTIMELFGG